MSDFKGAIKKISSSKKFKFGAYSILLTLAGITIAVLLNVGLTVLEENYDLRLDMTQNKQYTLTDQTKTVLGSVQKDIFIYPLAAVGSEDKQLMELLQKYKTLNPRVKVETKDPDKDPRFMEQFTKQGETIPKDAVIVSDAERKLFRVLKRIGDLYQYEYNNQQDPYSPTGMQIIAEQSITQSIKYISNGYMPTIYIVQGHGESQLADLFYAREFLEKENYKLDTLNITQSPDKVKAGDLLVFIAPAADLSEPEYDLLKPLMEKGGRFYFLFDPVKLNGKPLPYFEKLFKLYDISLKQGLVFERKTDYLASNLPLMIVPKADSHVVTSAVSTYKLPVIVLNSGAIRLPEVAPETTMKITPLLTSSEESYLKKTLTEKYEKEEGDESGPFVLAAAVEKKNSAEEADSTRFVIIYNTEFLTNQMLVERSSNIFLLMNGVDWMQNAEDKIYIRGKTVTPEVLGFKNESEKNTVIALSCFTIPVLLLIAGIVVYVRRKHL